jgi:hypothetical protein
MNIIEATRPSLNSLEQAERSERALCGEYQGAFTGKGFAKFLQKTCQEIT